MEIEIHDDDQVSLRVSLDELGTISNALNEVCTGIDVVNFKSKMGANRNEVDQKLDEISESYDKMEEEGLRDGLVSFTDRELLMVIGALKEVCHEIEDWEIPIRMGAELDEIDEILVELITVYQKMKKPGP